MKRTWLGIGILVLFFVLGLWGSHALAKLHDPLAHQLEQAAEKALRGDGAAAEQLAKSARKDWDRHWHTTAILADHTPMDEIDAHFARMEIYAKAERWTDFAAQCNQLAALVTATAEAHTFTWWNIL